MEKDGISYACLARVVREGGFTVRGHYCTELGLTGLYRSPLSSVSLSFLGTVSVSAQFQTTIWLMTLPVSTAVFSTCGMGVFVFALAALLSLPKQLVTVFIGVILEQSGTGTTSSTDRIVSDVVLVVTIAITIAAGYYIYVLINRVKPSIIYARRKARYVLPIL